MFLTVPKLPNSQSLQSFHQIPASKAHYTQSLSSWTFTNKERVCGLVCSINLCYNIHQQLFESMLNLPHILLGVGLKGTGKPGDIIKVCALLPCTTCLRWWCGAGVGPVWVLDVESRPINSSAMMWYFDCLRTSGVLLCFWKGDVV